jgi:predicted nucleic acid-binding Zn ribbon protein
MPIYEFLCTQCDASRDVILDHRIKNDLELICVHCGGVMRAAKVSGFHVVSSSAGANKVRAHSLPQGAESCGHNHPHACTNVVTPRKPNPFRDQIDAAHGKPTPE